MSIRDIADFRADFPDDAIEDERGFVRYPGLGVTEAIAQMCRDMGFHVPAPKGEKELGWAFEVHVGKRRYWFRLSDLGDRIILISRDMTRYEPTPGDIGHEELLRRLDAAMTADGRFSDVAWYTDAEYRSAGQKSAKPARIKLPLRLLPAEVARATGITLAGVLALGFGLIELWNAFGSLANGRMAIAGLHALASVASITIFLRLPVIISWFEWREFQLRRPGSKANSSRGD